MICGPLEGVKVWAMKRFDLIEKRVPLRHDPGYEMQSERFLSTTILPTIQKLGVSLSTNPDICFLRARVDKSVVLDDCKLSGKTRDWGQVSIKSLVESIVGASCHSYRSQELRFLDCDLDAVDDNLTPGNETIGIQS
jgi:hypothetical protein